MENKHDIYVNVRLLPVGWSCVNDIEKCQSEDFD